jgi:Tfp pilus assembly protein PilV
LAALLVVMLVAAALVESMLATHRQSQRYQLQTQAQWLAEAGLSRAAAQLASQSDYTGEVWQAPVSESDGGESDVGESDVGQVTIRVQPATDEAPRRVVVEAIYPPHEHHRVLVRRELNLEP